jgi:hypothetical protein
MDQLEWIKYPVMFPYGTFNTLEPYEVPDPEDIPKEILCIVFNLNYAGLFLPKRWVAGQQKTLFKYRCMDCAQNLDIDWYTDEFTSDRYVLESVEKQMKEHVRNHVTFGAWGISVYRNMKEKK